VKTFIDCLKATLAMIVFLFLIVFFMFQAGQWEGPLFVKRDLLTLSVFDGSDSHRPPGTEAGSVSGTPARLPGRDK